MLVYYGSKSKLIEAQRALTVIFKDMTRMQIDINAHGKFDFTNATTEQLGEVLRKAWLGRTVEIKTYLYLSRKVLAKTIDSKSVYINRWNMDRSQSSINGTVGHELIHAIDNSTPEYVFGHGDNSPKNKGNSFPYWFGSYIQKRSIEMYEVKSG